MAQTSSAEYAAMFKFVVDNFYKVAALESIQRLKLQSINQLFSNIKQYSMTEITRNKENS